MTQPELTSTNAQQAPTAAAVKVDSVERASILSAEHAEAQALSRECQWDAVDPKQFFDTAIAAMPSALHRYRYDEEHLIPYEDPLNALELYLLSRLPANVLPEHDDQIEGGLTTIASIRLCLGDEVRSRAFLESVAEAVQHLETRTQDTIEVLDAGCGALGLLGIYAALSSPRVRVTALELNPASAVMAQTVADSLGLSDRFRVIQADATQYVPDTELDLLVSETMNTALTSEPMVQVMSNLQPYVKPHGLSLPEHISVLAAIIPLNQDLFPEAFVKSYGRATKIFHAVWRQIAEYRPGDNLEVIKMEITGEELPSSGAKIALASEVRVLGSKTIELYDSAITVPMFLSRGVQEGDWQLFGQKINSVTISYQPGQPQDQIRTRFQLKY